MFYGSIEHYVLNSGGRPACHAAVYLLLDPEPRGSGDHHAPRAGAIHSVDATCCSGNCYGLIATTIEEGKKARFGR